MNSLPDTFSIMNIDGIEKMEEHGPEKLFKSLLTQYKKYGNDDEIIRLKKAFDFGKNIHKHQSRESGAEYFTHPIIAALLMMEYKPDADLIIATLLHDTIEDSLDVHTSKDIKEAFGADVFSLIDGVSKVKSITGDKQQSSIQTLQKLFVFGSKDIRVLIIKIFDRAHNIITIAGKKDSKKRRKKIEEALHIYIPAAERLGLWKIKKILEDACIRNIMPQKYEEIMNISTQSRDLKDTILQSCKKIPALSSASIEVKNYAITSVIQQSARKNITSEDTFFVRCTVDSIDDCYSLLSEISAVYPQKPLFFKDLISSPKQNGYAALHSTHIVNNAHAIRVHIVTKEMQERNDNGCFVHLHNKKNSISFFKEQSDSLYSEYNDTEQSFLSFLQSDILSQKITIHHAKKGEIILSQGATLMDAALSLYPEQFIYIQNGSINGEEKPFTTILNEHDIVDFSYRKHSCFQREWMYYAKTYKGKKVIQAYLSLKSESEKLQTGSHLLQLSFDNAKQGEWDAILHKFPAILQHFHVDDIQQFIIRIAEGKIDEAEVLNQYMKYKGKKKSWIQKCAEACIPSFFRGNIEKAHRDRMIISFSTSVLSGAKSEEVYKELCKEHNIPILQTKTQTTTKGTTGRIHVEADEYRKLLSLHSSLKHDPRFSISLFPPTSFILKILSLFVIPFLISLGIFSVLSKNTLQDNIWFLYIGAFLMALSNAIGYSYISKFFSWVRYNKTMLFAFIIMNVCATGLYVYTFLQKGYDIYHLDFYFPLLVILLSMAFPILFFKKSQNKESHVEYTEKELLEKKRQEKIGYLIRIGAVVIWGLQPLLIRYSPITEMDLTSRAFFILLGGAIVSALAIGVLYFFGEKKNWHPKIPMNKYFIMSTIALLIIIFCVHASLNHTTGTNFILLNNFAPIFALLIAAILWREKIPYLQSKKNIILIFLIFFIGSIGSSFLFYNDFINSTPGNTLGNLFALGYMVMDVLLTISMIQYAKKLKDYQSYFVNFYMHLLGAAIVALPILFFFRDTLFSYTMEHYLWIIGFSMFVGFGLVLNYEAFRRMDGFIAFLMFNISILITFTIEAFYLGAIPPTLLLIVGGSMIMGASIFAEVINTKAEKKS